MRTPAQHNALRTWRLGSDYTRRDADFDSWDKTDRLFRFPARGDTMNSTRRVPVNDWTRLRWLAENDVHTEFLDAGIGCCWFAHQGDQEPVSGDTEDAAITRLARANGLKLWRDAELQPRDRGGPGPKLGSR